MPARVLVTPFTPATSSVNKALVLRGAATPEQIASAIAIYVYQVAQPNIIHDVLPQLP